MFIEFMKDVGIWFLLFVVLIGSLIVFGVELQLDYRCENYQKLTGTETARMKFDACYLNTENGWQRYDEYKFRNIARDAI